MGERDGQHFLGRRHLEVQRKVGGLLYALEVRIANVATIFTQMRRDAVPADLRHDFCRTDRVRMIAAARIPDGCDVVDINAQSQAWGMRQIDQAALLPGLVTGMAARSAGTSSSVYVGKLMSTRG